MSVQSTLTTFYCARKRSTVEEIKKHSKVRIIDEHSLESKTFPEPVDDGTVLIVQKKGETINKIQEDIPDVVTRRDECRASGGLKKSVKNTRIKIRLQEGKRENTKQLKSIRQTSLRDIFVNLKDRGNEGCDTEVNKHLPVETRPEPENASYLNETTADAVSSEDLKDSLENKKKAVEQNESLRKSPWKKPVVFEKKGNLSPCKVNDTKRFLFKTATSSENAVSAKERHAESRKKEEQRSTAASGSLVKMSRKELSLSEIKERLKGNPRLAELRESISRLSSCAAQIREADREKDVSSKPSLKKFNVIEFEVPVLSSPKKTMIASPCKTPPSSPVPAYQRYAHLTSPIRTPLSPTRSLFTSPSKTSPLGLPYQYRCLAEVFRCVDVVASMMVSRKELITFNKLRPAVQEMLRKSITERHLGQIKRVFPEAFEYCYKKINQLTVSSAKAERYELILRPILKTKEGEDNSESKSDDTTQSEGKAICLTPTLLMERRHKFHKKLLEIVKDHHEEFLQSLDPPMTVPREKLTRWHPAFEVDLLPEVEPSELPQPPDAPEKCSSAKDVLGRARDLFGCNSRMERALENVSMTDSKGKDGGVSALNNPSTSEIAPLTNPALKGIPLALLKKVRERQAAKALMAMTMSPAEEKQAERLSRLPELARIFRGIFVSERKGVLSLETILKKLGDSYRANLTTTELEEHIKLLEESLPGWITRCTIRHTDYLKLAKDADLSRVISKLEKLAHNTKG